MKLFNLDPGLLKKMKIKKIKDNRLAVPVTTIVPAQCMGSGLGSAHVAAGDYDVMTSDPAPLIEPLLDATANIANLLKIGRKS